MTGLAGCSGSGHLHERDGHGDDRSEERLADEIVFTREQAEAAGLQVETVAARTFSRVMKVSGQIQVSYGGEITLAAMADGIVSFTNSSIVEGTMVRSGETIVSIAAGNLPEGDPGVKAKIAYETALKEYQRAKDLIEATIISARDFEQARLTFETARTVYEAQAASRTPSGVRVTSPRNGFIRNRFVRQGEYVSVGQPIVTISQNRRLHLRADVPGKYYRNIREIRSAHFKTSYDDTIYKLADMNGRLLSVGQVPGTSSACVPVTFEFDNTDNLLPDSFAEIFLVGEPQEGVIAIPVSAVTEEQGVYFVYLRLDDEGYRKQEVTLGAGDGERIRVTGGLKESDILVTAGVCQLKLAAGVGAAVEGHTHSH